MSSFFQKVVVRSGISELFAVNAIARACDRARVNPDKLSPMTLKVALPEIERTIRTFCPQDAGQIMPRLRLLARHDHAPEPIESSLGPDVTVETSG